MTFYAVWSEDVYVITEGENVTWTKGCEEGLSYTVERPSGNELTYDFFDYIEIDNVTVDKENYTTALGSLHLTLKPEYLETLRSAKHEIRFHFKEKEVGTIFTVKDKEKDKDDDKDKDKDKDRDGGYIPPITGIE